MIRIRLVVAIAVLATGQLNAQSACLPNTTDAKIYVGGVKLTLAIIDSALIAGVGLLKVDTSLVTLVTDNTVCQNALATFRQVANDTTSSEPTSAYVIQAGPSRLVVIHPNYGSGEVSSHIILNAATYAYLGRYGG